MMFSITFELVPVRIHSRNSGAYLDCFVVLPQKLRGVDPPLGGDPLSIWNVLSMKEHARDAGAGGRGRAQGRKKVAKTPISRSTLFGDTTKKRGSGNSGARTTPFHEKCASKLRDSIQSFRRVNRNARVGSWANSFAKLERSGVERERIKEVLIWYCRELPQRYPEKHHGFLPVALSGAAFYEKWEKIEAAFDRGHSTKERKQENRDVEVQKASLKRLEEQERDEQRWLAENYIEDLV